MIYLFIFAPYYFYMQSIQNQEIELHHGLLLFKPKKKTCNYGFILNYQQAKLKISFELQLTFHGITSQNFATYSINRKSMRINNEEPFLMLYKIANNMANAIYPVEFTINQNLECVQISNHKEIIVRCQAVEQKITDYYLGDIPQKMIATFKENYSNVENLKKQIENDISFQLLFFPIYKAYNHLLQSKIDYNFVIDDTKIDFELTQQIEKKFDDNKKVVVQVASKTNKQNLNSFLANYRLHAKNHNIASVIGTVVYPIGKETETLDFECYHLNS